MGYSEDEIDKALEEYRDEYPGVKFVKCKCLFVEIEEKDDLE